MKKDFYLLCAGIILYAIGSVLVMGVFVPYGKYVALFAYIVWWLLCVLLVKKLYPVFKLSINLKVLIGLLLLAIIYVVIFQVDVEEVLFGFVSGLSVALLIWGLIGAWISQNVEIKLKK